MINNILSILTVSHSSSGGLNLFSKIKRIKNFNIKKQRSIHPNSAKLKRSIENSCSKSVSKTTLMLV